MTGGRGQMADWLVGPALGWLWDSTGVPHIPVPGLVRFGFLKMGKGRGYSLWVDPDRDKQILPCSTRSGLVIMPPTAGRWRRWSRPCRRCAALIVALTVVAEVGDFANPHELMAYLGLVPSERSSGASVGRGAITKTGNAPARRVLIKGVWTYRLQAKGQPQAARPDRTLAPSGPRGRRRLAAAGKPEVGRDHSDRP
jgi:transposase IS116/IS110/IS902 family protein